MIMWLFRSRGRGYAAPRVSRSGLPRVPAGPAPGQQGQHVLSTAMIPPPLSAPPPPPPASGDAPDDRPPHCDQAVLHAPGECRYCDALPDWQRLRELWGIAFTGHPPRDLGHGWREVPCPSDVRRPGGVNQLWPGNQPRTDGGM